MKVFVTLSIALLLTGCAVVRDWIDKQTPVAVAEVGRLANCNTPGAEWQVHYFADSASLRAWEQARGIELTDADPEMRGPYVLAELGERKLDGYGLVVSPDAAVHGDDRLALRSTQLYPQQIGGKAAITSPCVLVAVPPRHYKSVELYDQEGLIRARTRIPTR